MKNALAIVIFLLFVLTAGYGGAQIRNPGNAAPGMPAGDHPLIKAYVIELKNISPNQAVQFLQGEGSRFKAFIPKEITGIDAIPKSMKLLIQTSDPQAAIRLTQLISLIDQPARLVLQAMLIIKPRPPKNEVGMPDPFTDMPMSQETVQTWVQSLIDTYRGSVILFSDQPVTLVTDRMEVIKPVKLSMPHFVPDIAGVMIYQVMADPRDLTIPAGQKLTADVTVKWLGNAAKLTDHTERQVSLVMDQTTLVPLHEMAPVDTNVELAPLPDINGRRYYLALTPNVIPPLIPEMGLVPTTDGSFIIRGGMGMAPARPGAAGGGTNLEDMPQRGN